MHKNYWELGLLSATATLEKLRDDVLEEMPTVAWCCAGGALAAALGTVNMLRELGFPGDDDGPKLEARERERRTRVVYETERQFGILGHRPIRMQLTFDVRPGETPLLSAGQLEELAEQLASQARLLLTQRGEREAREAPTDKLALALQITPRRAVAALRSQLQRVTSVLRAHGYAANVQEIESLLVETVGYE